MNLLLLPSAQPEKAVCLLISSRNREIRQSLSNHLHTVLEIVFQGRRPRVRFFPGNARK